MWVRNPNQKSSASQWLNGSHYPPLAQTPFAALRSSREAGELSWVDFKRDDSQSEVFYYSIFISSKTGLGEPFVCAYWKIWATSSLSDLIQIISQSGLLDSDWVREVLGLSPNVGLEALAESLNIPEGSQDKDSLKVLTELPRSQSMKVLTLLVGSLVIVIMKNEGATKELTSTTWERIMG
ncbi:unnamed protein product [Lactuca saligna]|uniref:Uncharacterized protein n=1 Tax=Lactuca saligna TaxID=75948 RepID=A0AA35YWM4_LACSI|nr:unnamed protein product [Lactuca saligna]